MGVHQRGPGGFLEYLQGDVPDFYNVPNADAEDLNIRHLREMLYWLSTRGESHGDYWLCVLFLERSCCVLIMAW